MKSTIQFLFRAGCGLLLTAQMGLISLQVHAETLSAVVNTLPTDSVFASDSFWYTPIPDDAPLHANSASLIDSFLRQKKTYYGTVAINFESWASPVYVVGPNTPKRRINQWVCMPKFGRDPGLVQQWAEVPWPEYAVPAGGSDAEMTIYQPSTDTIWEFWLTRKVGEQWQACWGGRMQNASKNEGRWPGFYGTTATGLPFLGGQITAEELSRGEIRHAIGIALPELESANVISWPAKRSDGSNPQKEPNRIPEGLRFRLDPHVDVDALKMHPAGKVIAKAAQKYGFVVWDCAGAIGIRAQNPKSYTAVGQPNPYVAILKNAPAWAILDGFPWDKLQFMPQDYGKP